jgi:DNA-binding response OmpR family regulator
MRRILIVDDEPNFANMVKLNLEATGYYEVRTENSGSQALRTALRYRPDLVLLDVIMPDKEGPEVMFQFKRDQEAKNIPIVFLTATITREEVSAQNGVIGGHAFVAKPGSIRELVDCIEKQLSVSMN